MAKKNDIGERTKTHGLSKTPEYAIWKGMIQRCTNPARNTYHNYGGIGVKVCAKWLASFTAFFTDMGPKPSPDHSLDRFPDKYGDYCPENCRWSTQKEQCNNKKTNAIATYQGETKTATEWAGVVGVSADTIMWRLRHGWTDEEALTIKTKRGGHYGCLKKRLYT